MNTLTEPQGKLNIEQCADLAEKISKLVAIAVAEEREACAKICDKYHMLPGFVLADEIRERGE